MHSRAKLLCQVRIIFVVGLAFWMVFVSAATDAAPRAEGQIPVVYTEGIIHGFALLKNTDGEVIAEGDLTQVPKGNVVTVRANFRFKDGSSMDETTVFSQRGHFRLLSDHVVQKGPTFKRPMDVSIDGKSGQVTVLYSEDGKEKTISEHLKLPSNVANGLMAILLKNIRPGTETVVSMVAATPKPRIVKLHMTAEGEDDFTASGLSRKATRYVIKIKIGGVAGVVAPLVGKQPEDIRVWVLPGDAPTFVRSEGPLFAEGPVWRIELTSPVWKEPAGN